MAASDHLSKNQFFEVHRGLQTEKPQQPLGIHWTDDADVAHVFASPGLEWGDKNTVISGKVNQKDIIHPDSKEGRKIAKKTAIFRPEHAEREVTIRPGATVLVTHITHKKERKGKFGVVRDRVRRYNPPKEMEA